jgi:hypothetical protein
MPAPNSAAPMTSKRCLTRSGDSGTHAMTIGVVTTT